MASAHFTDWDGNERVIDPIEDLTMTQPYWMVKYDGVREFIHFNDVKYARIEGEEELIAKAAKARVGNPEELARQLGIEP